MERGTCQYDCANPPAHLAPNPDISGIGVSLAYTLTAGLSVGLVLVYYIFVFRPDLHIPIRQSTHNAPRERRVETNPIDEYLLCWRLGSKASWTSADGLGRWNRTRAALERCMLLISDLQLITGLAIITSGFAQLRCGISAYHWKRVVQLAWFSSVTHLCCLTFLRDYLYTHRSAQLWRVPGMIALIIMLVTALGFTAHFAFNDVDAMLISRPRPYDHAICFLGHHEILPQSAVNETFFGYKTDDVVRWAHREFDTSRDRVICSSILLAIGALNRVWRLYDAPSAIYMSVRTWGGQKLAAWLEELFLSTRSDRNAPSWETMLIYCPILTLVLGMHVLLDMYTSKAFEVWWLLVSFTWGASDLWPLRVTVHESGSREWTFGQMIAILVLVAPVVTLAESFLGAIRPTRPGQAPDRSFTMERFTLRWPLQVSSTDNQLLASSTVPQRRLHPARRYYSKSLTFRMAIFAALAAIIWGSAWTLYLLSPWEENSLTFGPMDISNSWPSPPIMFAMFFVCLLFSLAFEFTELLPREGRRTLGTIYFLGFSFIIASSALVLPALYYVEEDVEVEAHRVAGRIVLGIFGVYLVLCVPVVHRDYVYACVRVWRDIRLHRDARR